MLLEGDSQGALTAVEAQGCRPDDFGTSTLEPHQALELGRLRQDVLLTQGKSPQLLSEAQGLVQRAPDSWFSWYFLARARLMLGRSAANPSQRAVDLNPEATWAQVLRCRAQAELSGGLDRPLYKTCLEACLSGPGAGSMCGVLLADTLLEIGFIVEALRVVHEAQMRWPESPELRAQLATIHLQVGRFVEAAEGFQAALQVDPAHREWWEQLAKALREVDPKGGEWKQAEARAKELGSPP